MKEKWLAVKGFEGLYEVSNLGRIKSIKYNRERLMKTSHQLNGYVKITLSKDNVQYTSRVHRLVADAFIPRQEGRDYVNHIDGDKDNNAVSNLEWVSVSENNKHAFKLGLKCAKGENNGRAVLTEAQVIEIYQLAHSGRRVKDIAEQYKISRSSVCHIKYGSRWGDTIQEYLKNLS